jgi:4-amino-4-deoxy-L-arabinose transferase-like glycosyltransferase
VLAGEAYAREFLLHQNLARYTTGFDHIETSLYYFHKLFFNFLPWSILLPFSLVHAWKRKLWFPLVWFIFTFLFFEFSRSKRAIYLLSCYPAAALLTGIYLKDSWHSLAEGPMTKWLVRAFGLILMLLPLAAVAVLPHVKAYRALFPQGDTLLMTAAIVLCVVGLLFFYNLIKSRPGWSLHPLFAYLVVCAIVYHSFYMPVLDRQVKSIRLVTSQVQAGPSDVYMYRVNSPALIYYMGRPVKIIHEPQEIENSGRNVTVIAEKRPETTRKLAPLFDVVKDVRYEKDTYSIYERSHGR